MNPRSSFKSYRGAIESRKGSAIPYLGVYLQDLTFIEDGNPETIDGLINFERLTQLYEVIEKVLLLQKQPYPFPIVEPLYSLFKALPALLNDKLLYPLSLNREPRDVQTLDQLK